MRIPFLPTDGQKSYLPVNLYFAPKKIYGRDALIGRPGLVEWLDLGTGEIRAWTEMGANLYVLLGDTLYKVNTTKGYTSLGTVGNSNGNAWMENNGSQVVIVENNQCWVWDGSTLSKSSDLPFSPGSLAYEGARFLAHDVNSEHFYESESYDGDDWNGVEHGITSVRPDNLNGIYTANSNVYAMGPKSGEIYYNSGGSNFSFSKVPGGNVPCGCKAEKSPVEFMGALYLLNENNVFVQVSSTPVRMKGELVERSLESMTRTTDCRGFSFTMNGQTFIVWTFPAAGKTYVLDLTTSLWFEWRTGTGRWSPNCYIKFNGQHLVGDYSNGKIYEISDTTYTDDGTYITRQHAVHIPKDNGFMTFSKFELEQESGVGLSTGQGSDPMAMLEISKNKGATWTALPMRSIGKAGEYSERVIWYKLGTHRNFSVRVTITDPVKTVWTGAYINGDGS